MFLPFSLCAAPLLYAGAGSVKMHPQTDTLCHPPGGSCMQVPTNLAEDHLCTFHGEPSAAQLGIHVCAAGVCVQQEIVARHSVGVLAALPNTLWKRVQVMLETAGQIERHP